MEYNKRTDLALETREMYQATNNCEVPGVAVETREKGKIKITCVKVLDETGEREIGKPRGNYITLEIPPHIHDSQKDYDDTCIAIKEELAQIVHLEKNDLTLIVGLGNWNITPDSLGPKVLESTLVTRHLFEIMPKEIDEGIRPVCAITPGVLGITGIETSEIIKGVVEKVHPKLIIAIDALASRKMERVGTTIQIADTGINPGSGIGNQRAALCQETLGVPVIAIGVPTVVDAATMANDTIDLVIDSLMAKSPKSSSFYETLKNIDRDEKYGIIESVLSPTFMGNLIVTPKEVDDIIEDISEIIANGINIALHPSIGVNDINRYS